MLKLENINKESLIFKFFEAVITHYGFGLVVAIVCFVIAKLVVYFFPLWFGIIGKIISLIIGLFFLAIAGMSLSAAIYNFLTTNKSPQKFKHRMQISTTALAKSLNIPSKKLFALLLELNLIEKKDKEWLLTNEGKKKGGVYKESQYGKYIAWPKDINIETPSSNSKNTTGDESLEFRNKFKAEHRTTDGHFVRSKAEMIVDNWLYTAGIVHAYEKKLPIEENVYSDFYIPNGKVYIEYWGYENDPKYLARKKEKIELYKKYDFSLIELQDKDIQNLDDIFPKLLLKYGIKTY